MEFKRKVVNNSQAYYINIPSDLAKWMGINEDAILLISDEEVAGTKTIRLWKAKK